MGEFRYADNTAPYAREAALFGVASELSKVPQIRQGFLSALPIVDLGSGKGAMAAAINRLRNEYGRPPADFIGCDVRSYPDGLNALYRKIIKGDATSEKTWRQILEQLPHGSDLIIGMAQDPAVIKQLAAKPELWSLVLTKRGIACFPTKDPLQDIPGTVVSLETARDNLFLTANHALILTPQTPSAV